MIVPVTPSSVAVMVTVPNAKALNVPTSSGDAMAWFEDDQETPVALLTVEPSE